METATSDLCFGATRVDVDQRKLLIDGKPVKLGARAFDVLVALVSGVTAQSARTSFSNWYGPTWWFRKTTCRCRFRHCASYGPQVIATISGLAIASPPISIRTVDGALATPAAAVVPSHQEPLYGRAEDLGAVSLLLQKHALVSIAGAGGIGKSSSHARSRPISVRHFLAGCGGSTCLSLSDGSLIAAAIAQALGVRASDDRPLLQTVVALLRNESALLVLDNCEHLLDAVTECTRALLAESHQLRILVTSQEALHAPEEQVYRLSGLPTDSALGTPAAVALFVARAEAADPRLRVTDSDRQTIAEICRRLDGMPLAIELAAARVRLLGIAGLRARLDERFNILTGGTRSVLRRHQTLRAALDWSHSLLSPDERTVFRRLGVFVGGFTLELAQGAAADDQIDLWAVLDALGHLVDKSSSPMAKSCRATGCSNRARFCAGTTRGLQRDPTLLRRHAEALLATSSRSTTGDLP